MTRPEPSSRGASIDGKVADWCRALRPPLREDEIDAALLMLRAFAQARDRSPRRRVVGVADQGDD